MRALPFLLLLPQIAPRILPIVASYLQCESCFASVVVVAHRLPSWTCLMHAMFVCCTGQLPFSVLALILHPLGRTFAMVRDGYLDPKRVPTVMDGPTLRVASRCRACHLSSLRIPCRACLS